MGIEDDIRELRSKVEELAFLFLSTLSDQQIATSGMSTERLKDVISDRAGTSSFRLDPQWSEHGTFLVASGVRGWGKGQSTDVRPVPQSVVDYCAKLEAFGLKIKIENPEPPK
jgi:hypothetical protein